MRKFTIKNRQKRKYTRKSAPQDVYRFSKVWATSLLPVSIVVVAFLTTMLINLNLRETTVSPAPQIEIPEISVTFSLTEVVKPFQSLPNLFSQPTAFVTSFLVLALDGLSYGMIALGDVFALALMFLDPRPGITNVGNVFVTLLTAMGTLGSAFINETQNISDLLIQSIVSTITTSISFVQMVSTTMFEYFGRGVETIAASIDFVAEKVGWIFSVIFDAIASIIQFIYEKISGFINGIIRTILIPFTFLEAFWEQMKPYLITLGYHIQLAASVLTSGLETMGNVASAVSR